MQEEQILTQWSDGGPVDATWEPAAVIAKFFDNQHLEDKVVSDGVGSVTPTVIPQAC
nr:Ty3/gypsy retrotransposon protein [Ipomoea trifida]